MLDTSDLDNAILNANKMLKNTLATLVSKKRTNQ